MKNQLTPDQLSEIESRLTAVERHLDFAAPTWDSYGGSGEWSVDAIRDAILELTAAIRLATGLTEPATPEEEET